MCYVVSFCFPHPSKWINAWIVARCQVMWQALLNNKLRKTDKMKSQSVFSGDLSPWFNSKKLKTHKLLQLLAQLQKTTQSGPGLPENQIIHCRLRPRLFLMYIETTNNRRTMLLKPTLRGKACTSHTLNCNQWFLIYMYIIRISWEINIHLIPFK